MKVEVSDIEGNLLCKECTEDIVRCDFCFKGLRKGDYVEARSTVKKKIYRGWISGYTGDRIYISDFDWNQSPSFGIDNVKLFSFYLLKVLILFSFKILNFFPRLNGFEISDTKGTQPFGNMVPTSQPQLFLYLVELMLLKLPIISKLFKTF